MASLKDIRRRISSVKNTQQITKAMKLVAASRLRRAQQAISSARPFAEKLEAITSRIISEIAATGGALEGDKKAQLLMGLHPLLAGGQTRLDENGEPGRKKIALIVVSSDRGLCGAYNTNVVRYALRYHKELTAENDVELFFVGRKGFEQFSRRNLKGEWFSDVYQGKFTVAKSDKIAKIFTDKFLAGEFDSIQVVYTQFKSAIAQTVAVKEILPLVISDTDKPAAGAQAQDGGDALPFLYEPGRKEILATLLPNLVKTQFYRVFVDSIASEFGAKMTAMDNATRNAGDMIKRLSLEANRVRQAGITKELMEIVGGAEALKG